MFHRVKSEVQETEQKDQEQTEAVYDKGEDRQSQSQDKNEAREEEVPARKYGYSQSKTQEEKAPMRTEEKEAVQGKYAPVQNEHETAEAARPAYQPSVARPSYSAPSSSPSYSPSTSSYTPPQAPEATPYTGSDRTLTIGRGINMSGEIDACDHLLVEGTVEAALKGAKILDIAESGTYYGTVEIEEATIAGRFEGDITVNGRLTLKSTGVITGSIAYRELEVEAGAVLDGRMTPLKGEVSQKSIDGYRAGSNASAMAKPKDVSGKKDPANAEAGLFSKARASY